MKRIFLFFAWLLFISGVKGYAQYQEANMLGLRLGASLTNIHDLKGIILDADYYSGYEMDDKMAFSPMAGFFYSYHKGGDLLGMSLGVDYWQMCASTEYEDVNGLSYTIGYQFYYVGLNSLLKVYPYRGFYLGTDFKAGICLSPHGISYDSNQDSPQLSSFGYSSTEVTRECLHESLSGSADVGVGLSIGYEFPNGLGIQGGYSYTFTDLVRTAVNEYGWMEKNNVADSFRLTVSYALGVDGR